MRQKYKKRPSPITIEPEICHGKPDIRTLRYPVGSILEHLFSADKFVDVLAKFPDLERDDPLACIEFANLSLKLHSWQLAVTEIA